MLSFTRRRARTVAPAPLEPAVDRRGYDRSPVTLSGYRQGVEPPNKGRKFPAEVLRPSEVLALIGGCGKGYAGKRNRALIVLLWRTGLRVSEALALQPRDVDLERGRVHVRHGKGDRARTVGMDAAAVAIVEDWMAARRELGVTSRQPVFCVISTPTVGEPIHAAYVRNMLKDAARRAGIDPERRVHPHGLRHTHAFELLEEGFRLDYIRRQLGHSSLQTTARYLDHLNPADVVDAVRARSWPGV